MKYNEQDSHDSEPYRMRLPSPLTPEAEEHSFISAHDDPCIRAADEAASPDGIS